ncbi:hypothetical protein Noda2021_04610 [Candidatus Dependentiae bacterium Noda2021]|nr:hypothetical protein Noda2021_04610 [Candidatus Dependentiae bacterium Noda2021]
MKLLSFLSLTLALTAFGLHAHQYQGQVVDLSSIPNANISNVIATHPFVIVDLYAHWCRPCQLMNPILYNIVRHRPQITVVKVNADSHAGSVAHLMGTRSLPTFAFFKNGSKVAEFTGGRSEAHMMAEVNRLF